MKTLLLTDEQGNDLKAYKGSGGDNIITLTDNLSKNTTSFIFDSHDIESLIEELERLRDLPF